MPAHLHRGAKAEKFALQYLKSKGLQLLEKNYSCPYGELDIVMMEREDLVFVEVRYRSSMQFGGAMASIDVSKQKKLRRTGEMFLQNHTKLHFSGCRFDVVAISGTPPDYELDWIISAF